MKEKGARGRLLIGVIVDLGGCVLLVIHLHDSLLDFNLEAVERDALGRLKHGQVDTFHT